MTVRLRGSEIYKYPSHTELTAMKKNTLNGVTWHNNLVADNYYVKKPNNESVSDINL
jgi:hypothetical protein